MDIARSIDFDNLSKGVNLSHTPSKSYDIDVNRQFDVYTTDSTFYPAEAPPVYQKSQSLDGFTATTIKACVRSELSKASHPHTFILKTPADPPNQAMDMEIRQAQQSDEVRRSLQLPRVKPNTSNERPTKVEPVNDIPSGRTHPQDTTVVCEVTGTAMEFSQPDETMPGRMGITKGASVSTIRVASRRKCSAVGEVRTVRSIWVIAHDGKSRIQQKLPKDSRIIPYTLWSNEKKVVIRHPTELRYYADQRCNSPYKIIKTSWVSYSFESASTSAEFQSALLSPLQLIRSLPTTRIVRLHNSPLMRTFSPRVQLCGLENLRIFQDATEPNSLVCMIHYSPNFVPANGEEYIVFRLYPPPRNSVRIREDGESCVKIKGLDIRGKPANEQSKKSKTPQSTIEQMEEDAYGSYSIEKIKIEFESGKEKREFLGLTRELQGLSSW
ncbi:MAG: hypothetical protein Q9219_004675 [cf. Caloplaca sp. 3 TL-2023]